VTKRDLLIVFVAAVALYLPTVRHGFVQDDRAIIASNPAAHSIPRAIVAFGAPYWPPETGAGLYRPATILSYAIDWTISGGRPGWFHLINALWHGVVTVLLVLVLARWLPPLAALAAGLVFAWHPVHVEAVASLVGRAELLVAAGILGAVLAARRRWWISAGLCAALAMFSKEHGVIAGVVILFDWWLRPHHASPFSGTERGSGSEHYPLGFWLALVLLTAGYLVLWRVIGWAGANDAAAIFYHGGMSGRLAVALPALWRAAVLLVLPVSLSSDYGPQVIATNAGFSLAAVLGLTVLVAVPALVVLCRRRAPAIAFTAALAALSYLPTSNLFFPSGIVLAERNLYLAVPLVAAALGMGMTWVAARRGLRPAVLCAALLLVLGVGRSFARLPAWRDNRAELLALLEDHPESYRGHGSAAAVLAGTGDTAGARREYRMADSLFPEDPFLIAARAIFLLGIGDTAGAAPLVARAQEMAAGGVGDRPALRARFVLELARGHRAQAAQIADSARRRFSGEARWYRFYLQ
jgi:hypothetical protein